MSLRLSNRATPKQIAMLRKLGYIGTGKYAPENLTVEEAADIIDGLFAQQDDYSEDWYREDNENNAWK